MIVHNVFVKRRFLDVRPDVIVAGGIASDSVRLCLDDEWEGLVIDVFLGSGDDAVQLRYEDEPVTIPANLISGPRLLPVSVVGRSEDGTVRLTTAMCPDAIRVVPSGQTDGSEPEPDEPDVPVGPVVTSYNQLTDKPTINGTVLQGDAPSLETYGAEQITRDAIDQICK